MDQRANMGYTDYTVYKDYTDYTGYTGYTDYTEYTDYTDYTDYTESPVRPGWAGNSNSGENCVFVFPGPARLPGWPTKK